MKKNISINLQGLIFHIEEDGYEVLGRYLAEVKAHFAPYRGHQEIVADIEGRIAELFGARLSPTQQVIALEDVEAMMAKMGRVSDFQTETDDEEELELVAGASAAQQAPPLPGTGNGGSASSGFGAGSYGGAGSAGSTGAAPADTAAEAGPRRLYRDIAHRKVAGVCAGLGQYFHVNPLWFRLGLLALVLLPGFGPNINFDNVHIGGGNGLSGLAFIAYIILWIVLPKRYDAPTPVDTLGAETGPLAGRKLYRDTDTAKIGGVAAGLAAYFRTDPTLIRILLLASLLLGGFGLLLYLILWAVLPVARTLSEKMQMRGDAVNLAGFASQASTAYAPGPDGPALTNRPLGTFLEDLARSLGPLVGVIGSAVRVFAGLMLTIMGFALLLGLLIMLGVGIGAVANSNNVVFGDVPAHVLFNGVPAWARLSWLLALGIPALALLLGGLGLLLRRRVIPRNATLSLLGLWLLSLVGGAFGIAQQSREYQYEGEVEQVERYPALTTPVLRLDARDLDRSSNQRVELRLAAADSNTVVEVRRTLSAQGASEDEARRTAGTSLDYTVRLSGDSSLIFDDAFSYLPQARYRDQKLRLTLRLPRERTFRISRQFASLLGDEGFVGNRQPNDAEQFRYRLRGNQLQRIGQTDAELRGILESQTANPDGLRININTDDEASDADETSSDEATDGSDNDDSDDDGAITLNYGGAPAFATDLAAYGSARRNFAEADFERVQVRGAYRVVVRPGRVFKVEAAGQQSDLDDLRIDRDGNELVIKPRRDLGSLFGNSDEGDEKVLVRIEMPALSRLTLAGAVRADVAELPRQETFRVAQAGNSHLRLRGDFGALKLDQAGFCRTTVAGRTDELNLSGAGACELAAAGLQAKRARLSLAGACKARIDVSEALRSSLVGASQVVYSGAVTEVKTSSVGASSVRRTK